MRVLDDCFPLLIGIAPMKYDAEAVRGMAAAFEPYYRRGHKYALVSVQPERSSPPTVADRKLLIEWLNSSSVRDQAGALCVGAAAVVEGRILRGALTAVLWFWKPPFPLATTVTAEHAIDHCIERLLQAGVHLPKEPSELEARALRVLSTALAETQTQQIARRSRP